MVTNHGLEALECNTAIIQEGTYLAKLQECIANHTKIDFNPAIIHEKKKNAALSKIHQARKHMPVVTKDKDNPPLLLRWESLMQYTTQGATPPQLRGQLNDHKEGYPMRQISVADKLAKILNKVFE